MRMAHNTALKSIISSPRVVPAQLGDHALLRLQALQGPNQHDVRRLSHPVTPWGFIPQCRAIGARRFLDFFPSNPEVVAMVLCGARDRHPTTNRPISRPSPPASPRQTRARSKNPMSRGATRRFLGRRHAGLPQHPCSSVRIRGSTSFTPPPPDHAPGGKTPCTVRTLSPRPSFRHIPPA